LQFVARTQHNIEGSTAATRYSTSMQLNRGTLYTEMIPYRARV